MVLDIRGGLKNTRLSSNPYVVFEELVSNAIDAFLIRENFSTSPLDMKIILEVDFYNDDLSIDDKSLTAKISCQDNGCGFGPDQLDAFLTKDTSYKDDLNITGIGQCRGAGRMQFFHYFSQVSVKSVYQDANEAFEVEMLYNHPEKLIKRESFTKIHLSPPVKVGTLISMDGLRKAARERLYQGTTLKEKFSALQLKNEILISQIQRLITLKEKIGNFSIDIICKENASFTKEEINHNDLPALADEESISIQELDPRTGQPLPGNYQAFQISHYRLDAKTYNLPQNIIAFCAKSSPVKNITTRYLRTKKEQTQPQDGFYHIILIESPYLDAHVNVQRDDFINIPEDIPNEDMFMTGNISYNGIYDNVDDIIYKKISSADWNRDDVLKEINQSYSISKQMIDDVKIHIRTGDTAGTLATRVLKKYQEQNIKNTEEILSLKEEIKKLSPNDANFREKLEHLSWKQTSSLKTLDIVSLTQLVVWRSTIIDVLRQVCNRELNLQNNGTRRNDEAFIHNILFPMRTDSLKEKNHDIWILGEEYLYFDYISSDLPLSKIKWKGRDNLFNSNLDNDSRLILKNRAEANKYKRPDIAIFSDEGSVIIIELKAPGVSLDDHQQELYFYALALASHSQGKLKKFYAYLIGDTINPDSIDGSVFTPFPTGNGFFRSAALKDSRTQANLGSLYQEILLYDDVIDKAEKRIKIYRDKLGLSTSIDKGVV
ncbi:hypothetical protein [Saccharibacter sp. 17.LH.SD]|uniref:hypothetical protein n=1 Tax=Saccharibacter sp. 17.LH.SD TaxID=2689393 RepID=UPI001927CA0C|nr:hypothetical protein [Saccharibacter sp. 17.LH.SD]